jgi:AcrR family transcriptional regulator
VTSAQTRAGAAVERALDSRHREASEEVERILAATVRVMERVNPDPPRVSDIVAEAGSSKKAFYRYFGGKDDLLLAVLERGVSIIVSYLDHQMAKEAAPQDKIACWICGALAQVAEPQLASMSRAVAGQITLGTAAGNTDTVMAPMRDLLLDPVRGLGSAEPERDADAVFELTAATMRRYVGAGAQPGPDHIDHLVRFCLRGLGVDT